MSNGYDHDLLLPLHEPEATLDPTTPAEWKALRATGHRMLDDMVDYLATIRERPAWQPVPAYVKARLAEPAPRRGAQLEAVYDEFRRDILPYPTGNIHPRFWGWVMGTGTPAGMLAELLAGAMNAHVAGYDQSAVVIERQVMRWLAELLGYPAESSGLLVNGGTAANLVGLTVARNAMAGFDVREAGLQRAHASQLLVYASTETHSWAVKSCELLGLGRSALRLVPVDADYRIDPDAVRTRIAADRKIGHRPICIIGNAGTVNTGAVDDLRALAKIARDERLWFHVDGAFGALAALAPELRPLVAGIEEADSLAFDLHKWGYVQYEAGCVLVRDEAAHRAAFGSSPAYLHSATRGISVDPLYFADLGVQLSRGFRALKVWMSLKTQGADAWGRLVQQNVDQSRYLAARIDSHPLLERLAPVPLNVVCFHYVVPGMPGEALDELNRAILVELQERGIAVPSGTTLARGGTSPGDVFALRVANTNHRSRREDFDTLLDAVVAIGSELEPVSS